MITLYTFSIPCETSNSADVTIGSSGGKGQTLVVVWKAAVAAAGAGGAPATSREGDTTTTTTVIPSGGLRRSLITSHLHPPSWLPGEGLYCF